MREQDEEAKKLFEARIAHIEGYQQRTIAELQDEIRSKWLLGGF